MPRLAALRARWNPAFAAVFGVFCVWALAIGLRHPLGPGQDQHYHVMSASLTARWWTGDAAVRSLYRFVNPLDANTLVYTWLFPFEVVLGPLRGYSVGFTLLYFVGYPVACASALRLMKRPAWGAILAFPFAYVKSWTYGGFIPFVSAAPFFVLAVAALHRVLEESALPLRARRGMVAFGAGCAVLTLLAHGHAYAWLMCVLCALTLVSLGVLLLGSVRTLTATLREALSRGLGALALVAPSLVIFAQWYFRTHGGEASAESTSYQPSVESWQEKITTLPSLFVHIKEDIEWAHVALLIGCAAFAALLSRGPKRGTLPTPEIALALSVASYFLLPFKVTGQSIGLRQPDIVSWLLPLVVYPQALRMARTRALAVLALLVGVSAYRLDYLGKKLGDLAAEYRGMLALSRQCPEPGGEIAYATFGSSFSTVWHAPSLQQAHESLAAICKIDTPVYDPTVHPHNLLPLRYRGKPPVPITILENPTRWYAQPGLWTQYRYVLVRNWRPSSSDVGPLEKVALLERESGDYHLYRAKPGGEATP